MVERPDGVCAARPSIERLPWVTARGGNADGEAGIFLRLGVGDGVCVGGPRRRAVRQQRAWCGRDANRIRGPWTGRDPSSVSRRPLAEEEPTTGHASSRTAASFVFTPMKRNPPAGKSQFRIYNSNLSKLDPKYLLISHVKFFSQKKKKKSSRKNGVGSDYEQEKEGEWLCRLYY